MRLLLDTHIVLWWRQNSQRLGGEARRAIEEADQVLISAASAWEIAIKTTIGRLRLKDPFAELVERSGFQELRICFHHAEQLKSLPVHHADPFDRMLIAQAQVEDLARLRLRPPRLRLARSLFLPPRYAGASRLDAKT